jgi:hypothetical protein
MGKTKEKDEDKQFDPAGAEPQFVPPDERREQGMALRGEVPREAHGRRSAKGRIEVAQVA